MLKEYQEIIDSKLKVLSQEGENKVLDLGEAINRFVEPGMNLHIASTHNRANAAADELIRRFHDRSPAFTVTAIGVGSITANLFAMGMVKKVITSYCGDAYPYPGPNRIFQEAYDRGDVEFENWSICSLPMRLLAGAVGIPFMPTKSMVGSTMAEENSSSFMTIEDPFGDGEKVGLARALNPDLSIIHGWAADKEGNTILFPPLMESVYGAMASERGVLVTVERLVSTDFIRRFNHSVKLPGSFVKSVSVVPFGAHPSGLYGAGMPEVETYAEDYQFISGLRKAHKAVDTTDQWIREWVLDCPSHEDYVRKLGWDRVMFLKGKSQPDSWVYELEAIGDDLPTDGEYNATEMMITVGGRLLKEIIKEKGYKTILAGVGASNLAAWMANCALNEDGYPVDLMAELGLYGYSPRPADPFIFNHRNLPTSKMLTDTITLMGIIMAGANNRCIGVLGAAQIDKWGNINTTKIPAVRYLMGSGGANDVASGAAEVLVAAVQSPERFVEKVPYVTSPGKRVTTLVSNMGLYRKAEAKGELILTGYFAAPERVSEGDKVREIREQCGWNLQVAGRLERIEPPIEDELRLLRLFDPHRQFLGK